MKNMLSIIAAFIIGVLPGFFIIFNAVFSDSNGKLGERFVTFILAIIVYSLLGLIFGIIIKKTPWKWAFSLSLPAIIILVLYSFKEPSLIFINIIYLCLTLASAWLGAYIGIKLKMRH